MDRERLAHDLDRTCRLHGEFRLRSGEVVGEYFDKYLFESQPELLRRVAGAMVPLVPERTELLGGLELGGVPIATMLSSLTGIPALFVRKKAKSYGTRRLAEGADVQGRVITLIEDVLTTGGAARSAAIELRATGATVKVVVCAIDRCVPGANRLHEINLDTRAVFTREDLDRARGRAVGVGVTDSCRCEVAARGPSCGSGPPTAPP